MAKVLGLSIGHDAAAALVVNGGIAAAAEEERFVQVKHSIGHAFPMRAANYCLSQAGLSPADLDFVALYKPIGISWYRDLIRPMLTAGIPVLKPRLEKDLVRDAIGFFTEAQLRRNPYGVSLMAVPPDQLRGVPHHVAHAASAYYCSGFSEADVLVADAAGSHEATSLYRGNGAELTLSKRIYWPHSLGYFYSAITEYLGYETREGRVASWAWPPMAAPTRPWNPS